MLRPNETAAILEKLAREREERFRNENLPRRQGIAGKCIWNVGRTGASRATSRKSRRPLQEVALEYIGKGVDRYEEADLGLVVRTDRAERRGVDPLWLVAADTLVEENSK
jgi:hypothetical protein